MTGAASVLVPTTMESGFKMTPQQLRAALTPRSKLLMLNSPSNPTGSVYTRAELEALADVVLDTNLAVLSDEIYERLVFGNAKATCFATLRPGLAERTLTVSGASKTLRHDRLAHGLDAGAGCTSSRRWATSRASRPATRAASASTRPWRRWKASRSASRRCAGSSRSAAIWCAAAVGLPGVSAVRCREAPSTPSSTCPPTSAARWAGARSSNAAEFCRASLETAHVNLVPGAAFGAEGYVRLSYAASREQLQGGLDRLEAWLTK